MLWAGEAEHLVVSGDCDATQSQEPGPLALGLTV